MKSTNNVTLTGRLTADATTNESKSFARFAIAHNMGDDVVFNDFVMFAKKGNRTVEIPFDILTKGTPVKVNAFMRRRVDSTAKNEDGTEKRTYRVDLIVKSIEVLADTKESINDIQISGRLTKDAFINEAGSFAGFAIAHNMGKDNTVYPEFSMFSKNHNRTIELPVDLLKKGTAVMVSAYQAMGKDKKVQFVVKSVVALTEEEAAAEDASADENAE